MVGMSLSLRYHGDMMWRTLIWMLISTGALAGADPDEHRPVQEGHARYDGKAMQVGTVYEGFLIRFAGREEVYLSPSRYRVAYTPDALKCRNTAEFPLPERSTGQWFLVTFEVLAVRETAIEEPAGSGNWGWQHEFDCMIEGLEPAK